ncbi:MAG: hypothetical protein V2J20_02765 [Wenzhouxiangella sp.]|jgi:hypothetical protein|nr:hypothetical protein [Wenzhouxiangella sp.]
MSTRSKSVFRFVSIGAALLLITACGNQVRDDAATFDRNQALADLLTEIEEVGVNETEEGIRVSPGVDQVLNGINAITLRQRTVLGEYRSRAETFPDVAAFMMAYQAEDADVFAAAVERFDQENTDAPISPKIAAYEQAGEAIYEANSELTKDITVQVAALGLLLTQYSGQVAEAAAASGAMSLLNRMTGDENSKFDPDQDLGAALVRARDQLRVNREATKLISDEKALIEEHVNREARFQQASGA